MKTYYIHAMGSACYDDNGLTFPEKRPISFIEIIRWPVREITGALKIRWANFLGHSNLPQVCIFEYPEDKIETLSDILYWVSDKLLIIREKNW